MEICNKKECTACMACICECPLQCITLKYDEYGIEYPEIDESKCIGCNKCREVCAALGFDEFYKNKNVYAAVAKEKKEQITSSSGGVSILLAKQFLKYGGVVYATCYEKNKSVAIKRFSSIDNIEHIKGSKYVISFMNDTLKRVKNDLEGGKQVLFIGTPCQCASIKKNIQAEKLVLIDLICHGVPSQRYLQEYIDILKKKKDMKGTIEKLYFRKGNKFIFGMRLEDGGYIEEAMNDSVYLKGFMKALFYRKSCYCCQYAQKERVGDITLGDFWGIGKLNKNISLEDGVSMVMVNSEKGCKFFKKLQGDIIFEERNLNEAIAGNTQLQCPSVAHKNHKKFMEKYKKYGFYKAAKKYIWFNMMKSKIRERIVH